VNNVADCWLLLSSFPLSKATMVSALSHCCSCCSTPSALNTLVSCFRIAKCSSDLAAIDPETAENIDIGIRYSDDNIEFSATYYTIDFDNRITFISADSGVGGINYDGASGVYRNDGGIESNGFELSLNYQLNDNWSIYSSYTNDDSSYVGSKEIGTAAGFLPGDKVINSVDDMFVLSTNYNQGNLRIGLSAKYTGKRNETGSYTQSVSGERFEADDYTVVDLNIGYGTSINSSVFKSFDLAFVVNNLTDKSYVSTGTGNGKTFFIGAPRTASLTFTADF